MTPASDLSDESRLPRPPRPMVAVALALVAGMHAGMALPWAAAVWGWLALLPPLFTISLLWRSRRIRGPEPPLGGLLLVGVAGLGCLLGSGLERGDAEALAQLPEIPTGEPVRITGVLAEEPRVIRDGVELVLDRAQLEPLRVDINGAPLPGRVAVFVSDEAASALNAHRARQMPVPGQPVRVWGSWRRVDELQTSPDPFDSLRYWRSRGIFSLVSVRPAARIGLGPPPHGPAAAASRTMRAARMALTRNLSEHLDGDSLLLARALLLGDAGALTQEHRQAFSRSGLSHLLAVSGLHTGFILLILLWLGRLLWLSPRAGACAAIFGLILYAALTGFRPPVVRAATMGVFLLTGFAIGRGATPLASLATAACFTLVAEPRNLIRLDWQLSYACALSIIVLAPPLRELLTLHGSSCAHRSPGRPPRAWQRRLDRWLMLPLAVMLAVQLGLVPIQLASFHQLSPWVILANLFAIQVAGVAVFGSLVMAVVGRIPGAGAIAWIARLPLEGLLRLADFFADLPGSGWNLLPLPPVLTALYYFLLASCPALQTGRLRVPPLALDRRQRLSLAWRLCACAVLLLVAALLSRAGGGHLDLYMLDVGQGDALVVRFPNGRLILIDGGPGTPVDQGRATVAPFLRSLGVNYIDVVVATHADADHIGGLPSVIDEFTVGMFVTGHDDAESQVYQRLQEALDRRAVPVVHAKPDTELPGFGDVRVYLLGPLAGTENNDASVVLLIDHDEVELLLTGDLESGGEALLAEGGRLPDVEVLKTGHHGSRSSTTAPLLHAARPEIALISAGRNNPYGHPAREVVERLERIGARALRTDQLGSVWLRSDGRSIRVFHFVASAARQASQLSRKPGTQSADAPL